MASILNSVKKMLGIQPEYTHFDADIIMDINSVFMILNQMGAGPVNGFTIEDETANWEDYLPDNPNFEAVKTYMYMKVRMMFDPPISSSVTEAIKNNIAELEWRINWMVESGELVNKEIEDLQTRMADVEATVTEHNKLFKTLVGIEQGG